MVTSSWNELIFSPNDSANRTMNRTSHASTKSKKRTSPTVTSSRDADVTPGSSGYDSGYSPPRKKTRSQTRSGVSSPTASSGDASSKHKKTKSRREQSSNAAIQQVDGGSDRTPAIHTAQQDKKIWTDKTFTRDETKQDLHSCVNERIRYEVLQPYEYPQSMQIIMRASKSKKKPVSNSAHFSHLRFHILLGLVSRCPWNASWMARRCFAGSG